MCRLEILKGVILILLLYLLNPVALGQGKVRIYPELSIGYRYIPLPLREVAYNTYMFYFPDPNFKGFNGSLGFIVKGIPFPNLDFRYRLHIRYAYHMHDIDYLNLMPTFGGRLIVLEKWDWLFDHRFGLYKNLSEKWQVGTGITLFNAGRENKQNMPPANSYKWVYSIQVNTWDLVLYRKLKYGVDIGLLTSYTLNGLPDRRNGHYLIFEIQLAKRFDFYEKT